ELPTAAYYLTLLVFVVPIVTSIVLGSEKLAFVGVLSFFLVIRLMFYVSTYFLVFPYGDPYGQFGVLRVFAQSSHISIIFPNIPTFDQTQYLAVLTNQYSQLPGFQILTLSFSRVTGLPLLESALAMTMLLDLGWFATAYALVRKILARTIVNLPNSVALCMAIITAVPPTFIPSYFKYDFPATLFLLASVLLLLRVYDNHDFKVMIPLTILSVAITVTHSITSLFWVLLLLPFALWTTAPSLFTALSSKIPFVLGKSIHWPKFTRQPPLHALLVFALLSFLSWFAFYAVYLVKYTSVSAGKVLASFSLCPLVGFFTIATLTVLGSRWPKLGKVAVVSLMIMLVSAVGVGFWASSYAPTGLYVQGSDISLASGRPVTWPGVASYLSFSGKQDCI